MTRFGFADADPVSWLRGGLNQSRRVGRIEGASSYWAKTTTGTGFLFDGELVSERWSRLPFFITGSFVLTGDRNPVGSARGAVLHTTAQIVFEGMFDDAASDVSARIAEVLAGSPPEEYCYTLALLDRWPGPVPPLQLAPGIPEPSETVPMHVYVIGYPQGGGLKVSLRDNRLVRVGEPAAPISAKIPTLYYRAPTEPGSAGSPVFNEHWEILAMHVGGGESKETPEYVDFPEFNFGLDMNSILENARPQIERSSVSDGLLRSIRAMLENPSRSTSDHGNFFSVFISYSHEDAVFAQRLYDAMRAAGIRAWLDRHQMQPGDDIYDRVEMAIREWDKGTAVLFTGIVEKLVG